MLSMLRDVESIVAEEATPYKASSNSSTYPRALELREHQHQGCQGPGSDNVGDHTAADISERKTLSASPHDTNNDMRGIYH